MTRLIPIAIFAVVLAVLPLIPGMPPFWIVLLDNIGLAALVAESLDLLGIAVRNAVNLFNPSVVVLSGFLAALHTAAADDNALLGEAIRSARETVRIQDAALGTDQLIVGAAELVFDKLIADPSSFVAG